MQSAMMKVSDDRPYAKARIKLPPGACDSHFHLFGPESLFPQSIRIRERRPQDYTGVSTIGDWLRHQEAYGLSRGVLVQSTWHDTSYEQVLHAVCLMPERLRGIIRPHYGITDKEIDLLDRAGIVGIRFQASHGQAIDDAADRLIRRVHEFGWAPHFVYRPATIEAWRRHILDTPGQFVIEHAGYQQPELGESAPAFKFLLECLDTDRGWVKLSPNFSKDDHIAPRMTPPFADTIDVIQKIIAHRPDRIVWGSDWPHSKWNPKPDDATFIDMMLYWAPDESTRNRIFVDNPQKLFGFPAISS